MSYYVVFLSMKDTNKSARFRSEHLAFLKKMRKEKKILINGKLTDGSGGLVVYIATNLEEVESFVNKDPYVIEGARDYVIKEWEMVTDIKI